MSANTNDFDKNTYDDHNEVFDDKSAEETLESSENNFAVNDTAQKELSVQKDKYMRLLAEFENYKKRTNAERLDLMQTAGKDIVTTFLDVADDMDRAEVQIQEESDLAQIKEGIQLVFNKFRNLLAARGVQAMSCINEEFDASSHEAVANVPVQDESQKGKIIDEVQKGYTLNHKIIRYPKVVVGN